MPTAPNKACELCGKEITDGGWLCPEHRTTDAARTAANATAHLYQTPAWRNFRLSVLRHNPRCQRLENGEQCHEPATVVHHIISPIKNKDLFLVPSNVLCVCAHHHHPLEGEPDVSRYVPSNWRPPSLGNVPDEEDGVRSPVVAKQRAAKPPAPHGERTMSAKDLMAFVRSYQPMLEQGRAKELCAEFQGPGAITAQQFLARERKCGRAL